MSERSLSTILTRPRSLAVAVSGGVDSLTLAVAAHRLRQGEGVIAYHAVSPAVPEEATERVRRHASREGMTFRIIDAGEFSDPDYRRNPVNRCFYCKSNLYRSIRAVLTDSTATIASGTNLDDLGDYRPGLAAAHDYQVTHPYVKAGMDKTAVRSLARELGLADLAELPAAPCLASRVETGLRIEPATLRLVDAVETSARRRLGQVTLRCRVRGSGLVLEIEESLLEGLTQEERNRLEREVRTVAHHHGATELSLHLEPYRRGSAFIHVR